MQEKFGTPRLNGHAIRASTSTNVFQPVKRPRPHFHSSLHFIYPGDLLFSQRQPHRPRGSTHVKDLPRTKRIFNRLTSGHMVYFPVKRGELYAHKKKGYQKT
ncbi:MAG: hypothetical protein CSA81_07120 [Acidobacteria bacterium]|nr:MAG: hypothetical protein CSA81_07120 [Acidobacteriota bacterium]